MEAFSAAGALAAITGVVAYFTAREKSVAAKLEIEKKGQEMLFHRMHELEGREMFREKRVDELNVAFIELRHRHDKLQWEHEELTKENAELSSRFAQEQKRSVALKAELDAMYNEVRGGGRNVAPPTRRLPP